MYDDSDDVDPLLLRRRQLRERGRRRVLSFAIVGAGLLVAAGIITIAVVAVRKRETVNTLGGVEPSSPALVPTSGPWSDSEGAKDSSKPSRPFEGQSSGKSVEGTVDLVSMEINDFIDAIGERPNEDKAVIVLSRKNQSDVHCHFPPQSGSARWLNDINRGDKMIVTGQLQSDGQHVTILVNCKVVSHSRR